MASRGPLLLACSARSARRTPRLHHTSLRPWLDQAHGARPVCHVSTARLRRHPGHTSLADSSLVRGFHTSRIVASADPQLFYGISAAYSGKGERLNHERNVFELGRSKLPTGVPPIRQPRHKRPRSGQDAFFASYVNDSPSVAFGVADGVGGWTDQGIDPADFAHSLCANMADEAMAYQGRAPEGVSRTQHFLQEAFVKVINDDSVPAGGSTACLAVADSNGKVEVANLGDSGFVHLRLNAVRHHSPAQTHAFNTPFQLSKIPKRMLRQMALFSGGIQQLGEFPRDASVTTHETRHGDILVFATDGVWDNLSPQDALQIVGKQMSRYGGWVDSENGIQVGQDLQQLTSEGEIGTEEAHTLQAVLAQAIVSEAKVASEDTKRDGPFAREVQRHYPQERWRGGKVDDICVVVAIAVESTA